MSWGTDTWCADTIRTGRLVTGVTLLAQAIYRRLTTPRGMLRGGQEESAYGFDISNYIGATGLRTAAAALPNIVRAELLKDDRLESVVVRTALDESTSTITLTVDAIPADETESFTLTLSASELEVSILGTGTP